MAGTEEALACSRIPRVIYTFWSCTEESRIDKDGYLGRGDDTDRSLGGSGKV
jgi:hypothetical protein